jgi:general stress protein 26
MAEKTDAEKVWDLMRKIDFCMLVTQEDGKLRSRPMSARVREEEHRVYFLTDTSGVKDEIIRDNPDVCLAFADKGGASFVSLSGHAEVSSDRAKIHDLWDNDAKAWWESPDDPRIRLITVTPEDAQYWDSPGKLAIMVAMAASAVTGKRPDDIGENRKVDL